MSDQLKETMAIFGMISLVVVLIVFGRLIGANLIEEAALAGLWGVGGVCLFVSGLL